MYRIRTNKEIEWARESSRINALAHQAVAEWLQPGIRKRELNQIAKQIIEKHGAEASFPTEYGFPRAICVSVNDEVGHGLPDEQPLLAGDIVKVDIGVKYQGYHSDAARTYRVESSTRQAGDLENDNQLLTGKLIDLTQRALFQGIENARPGQRVSDISHAIWRTVEPSGFRLIRNAFGHGVGRKLHEEPRIANYGPANWGPRLRAGMILAVEPLVTVGSRYTRTLDNGWTTVTIDHSLSAHFEDTLLITEQGPEILTRLPDSKADVWTSFGLPAVEKLSDRFRIRPQTATDRTILLKMANQQMNPILMEAWGQKVDPAILDTAGSVTTVIESVAGEISGFFTVTRKADALFLNTLVIDSPFQNHGLGKLVMQHLDQEARQQAIPAVELWVQTNNRKAIRFYEKIGFASVDRPYFNTIAMRKRVI